MGRIAVILHQIHILGDISVGTAQRLPVGIGISLHLVRYIKGIILGEAVLRVPGAGVRALHTLCRLDAEQPVAAVVARHESADLLAGLYILSRHAI